MTKEGNHSTGILTYILHSAKSSYSINWKVINPMLTCLQLGWQAPGHTYLPEVEAGRPSPALSLPVHSCPAAKSPMGLTGKWTEWILLWLLAVHLLTPGFHWDTREKKTSSFWNQTNRNTECQLFQWCEDAHKDAEHWKYQARLGWRERLWLKALVAVPRGPWIWFLAPIWWLTTICNLLLTSRDLACGCMHTHAGENTCAHRFLCVLNTSRAIQLHGLNNNWILGLWISRQPLMG